MIINWCASHEDSCRQLTYFAPENAMSSIAKARSTNTMYLQCPAVVEFYKNTFLIRSPIDYTIILNRQGGNTLVDGSPRANAFMAEFLDLSANRPEDKYITIQLGFDYLFYSKQSVEIETLPVILEEAPIKNIRVIPGKFNIAKWFRPLSFAFEVIDDTQPIHIKRGDPLYYLRFVTDEKIKFNYTEMSPSMHSAIRSAVDLKQLMPRNSLATNYELFERKVKSFWKRQCPFKRMIKR